MVHRATRSELIGRLFNFANNPITIAAVALTTVSGLMIIVFLIVNLLGGLHDNPYIGMFAYGVLPIFFIMGLVAIPIGMLIRRRKLARAGTSEEEISKHPWLDFNDPKLRRLATMFLVLTSVNGVILGSTSFLAVEHTESVSFCGETCHTVMQPEFSAYQNSPHSRVKCVECHIGPGASWYVKSKLDGLRQVWHTVLDSYHRPIMTPLHTLRPARETCEQCHWPTKHHGDKLRLFARYRTDEANTPSYTAMLLKTGGGSLDLGTHGGIHWWHIYSDNKIRFYSPDERREEIAWVELTTPDGEVRTYTREGDELPPLDEIEANARIMDCIDCHNRPTHFFEPPSKAVDTVLENLEELRDLPFYKRQAVKAIEETYPSHPEGMTGVRNALESFYSEEYPELWQERSDLVKLGADVASRVYGRTVFPAMNTGWETHPNHIGHDDSPGCWRCHDDELATADGEHTIPSDCENCHVFLVEDSPEIPDLASLINGG